MAPGGRAPANPKNVRVPWDIVQFRPFFLIRSLLLTGAERPAVGFRAQAIGFSDSRAGMQGRCVWTDERGDMIYSELKGEAVGSANYIVGTFIGGTGRYVGVTGDYTFQWQYVVDADGGVSGRVVDFKGRASTQCCRDVMLAPPSSGFLRNL